MHSLGFFFGERYLLAIQGTYVGYTCELSGVNGGAPPPHGVGYLSAGWLSATETGAYHPPGGLALPGKSLGAYALQKSGESSLRT